jgi:hypothetical protein
MENKDTGSHEGLSWTVVLARAQEEGFEGWESKE